MTLGEIIKTRRTELNISQEQLALCLGLKNRTSISKVELGKTSLNYEQLKIVMKMLKLKPNQLFGKEKIEMETKETKQNNDSVKTKYGEVKVIENEDNSITITYNINKKIKK